MASSVAEQLKRSLECGDFESASQLTEEYGRKIQQEVRAARTPAERIAIVEAARSFLEDRLHLARVMRAHLSSQAHSATGLASYHENAALDSWETDC